MATSYYVSLLQYKLMVCTNDHKDSQESELGMHDDVILIPTQTSTRIRSPDRPAHSQSLYQLSYRAHTTSIEVLK
jgi:hypothetical protein